MHRRGFRPASRDRVVRNAPLRRRGRSVTRVVRYAEIDRGKTRVEFNAGLRETRTGTGDRVPQRSVAAQAVVSERLGWQEVVAKPTQNPSHAARCRLLFRFQWRCRCCRRHRPSCR